MNHSAVIYKYWCIDVFVLKQIQTPFGKDHTYWGYLFSELNVSEDLFFTDN